MKRQPAPYGALATLNDACYPWMVLDGYYANFGDGGDGVDVHTSDRGGGGLWTRGLYQDGIEDEPYGT